MKIVVSSFSQQRRKNQFSGLETVSSGESSEKEKLLPLSLSLRILLPELERNFILCCSCRHLVGDRSNSSSVRRRVIFWLNSTRAGCNDVVGTRFNRYCRNPGQRRGTFATSERHFFSISFNRGLRCSSTTASNVW